MSWKILVLLAAGTPNPRIAEELVVSLDTVKKHVSHLLGKLGAANRTEAANRARQLGLIPSRVRAAVAHGPAGGHGDQGGTRGQHEDPGGQQACCAHRGRSGIAFHEQPVWRFDIAPLFLGG